MWTRIFSIFQSGFGGQSLAFPNSRFHFVVVDVVLGSFRPESSLLSFRFTDAPLPPPTMQGYHPMPHEVEIAHTKKLFRRRRNDRR